MSGYIGSQPADSFLSISSQQITGNGTATYTLNSNVTNPEDIAIFVNNVRQNVNTYSVSNNQVTLGGTIASSDSCYVIFLGKTLATVNPPSGSVGLTELSATGTKNNTTFLRGDNTFATPIGGDNTPSFAVHGSGSGQSLSDNTDTKVEFGTEIYDTDNAFSSNKFTVPNNESGKYFFNVNLFFEGRGENDYRRFQASFRKNGGGLSLPSSLQLVRENYSNTMRANGVSFSIVLDLAVSDYIEVYTLQDNSANGSRQLEQAYFQGYKLIGV